MTAASGQELLDVAVRAARAAGDVLLEHFGALDRLSVRTKSTATDPVSQADEAAERVIRQLLARERTDDAIVGEEGDDKLGTTGVMWLVDPLDGTVNFLFGIPQWCVSVAAQGRAGAILDPVRGELFSVCAGEPPQLDGRPLASRAAGGKDLAASLVATGFGYDPEVRRRQAAVVAEVLPRARDVRRLGAAALDLAWTAAGRFDAYYERGLNPWDLGAGTLLCEAAGLEVRTLGARDGLPAGLLAAPPAIAGELESLVG